MAINARSRAVLNQVVNLHYQTCEPVGSSLICKTRTLPVSPATIRNIMGRLESSGHLSQPHVSAGRLPTDLGYRTYVNGLKLNANPLDESDRRQLSKNIAEAPNPVGALRSIADYINRGTELVTFHLPFRHTGIRLNHLHLERISKDKLLALWISQGGQTFQSILEIDEGSVNRSLTEKTSNYFNNAFKGCNLLEIQRRISQNLSTETGSWDLLMGGAARIANLLMAEASQLDAIDFKGLSKVLAMPEFKDIDQVRAVLGILEHQGKIKELIAHTLNDEEGVIFFIGEEMADPDLDRLAIAVAKFRNQGNWLGCVGVIGPKRMPYLRALQILRFASSKIASRAF